MRNPSQKKQSTSKTQEVEKISTPPKSQTSIASILSAIYVKTQEDSEPDLNIPDKNENKPKTASQQRSKSKYNSAKYVPPTKLKEERIPTPPPIGKWFSLIQPKIGLIETFIIF